MSHDNAGCGVTTCFPFLYSYPHVSHPPPLSTPSPCFSSTHMSPSLYFPSPPSCSPSPPCPPPSPMFPPLILLYVPLPVTIMPYLSRDTTYCYRHCKGILHFPLLSVSHFALTHARPDCFSLIDLRPRHITLSDSCLETPSRALPHGQPRSLLSLPLFPLTSL